MSALTFSTWVGHVAGRMIIGLLGLHMLFPDAEQMTAESGLEAQQKQDLSFTPLAMPCLSGPGAIAVAITMSSSLDGRHGLDEVAAYAGVVLAIVLTAIISNMPCGSHSQRCNTPRCFQGSQHTFRARLTAGV
jgi:small neutral amino acid transporter SnatA (MarC family)